MNAAMHTPRPESIALRQRIFAVLRAATRPMTAPELAIKLNAAPGGGTRVAARNLRPHLIAMKEAGQVVKWPMRGGLYWGYSPTYVGQDEQPEGQS